jgi:iron complex outermembrane recepter protein
MLALSNIFVIMKKHSIFIASLCGLSAMAQQVKKDSTLIEEVVVSAVLGKSKAKQTPFAIQSIGSKVMARSVESNIMEVLARATPGLNTVKTGPNVSKPFIRGLGYNRVLSLYDGLRQEGQQWGDEHGVEVDPYSVHHAEVIKGPASLMYGSDALAGVVAMFPASAPSNVGPWQGKYIAEHQHNHGLIGHAFQLQKRSKNLFFSLNLSQRMAQNYRNALDGRVYNTNFNEKNLGAQLTYLSGQSFSKLAFSFYQNLQAIPDGSRQTNSRAFTKQVFEAEQDVLDNRPIAHAQDLNSYALPILHQNIRHIRLYNNNHYQHDLGDFDLNLAWQSNRRQEFNHPTLPSLSGVNLVLNTFNYALKFQSVKYLDFRSSFGANGMLQSNKNGQATDFPIPDYQMIDGGVYAFQQWQPGDWSLNAGLRYDLRQVFWPDFYVGKNTSHGFDEAQAPNGQNNLQFAKADLNFSGLSASFGSTYQYGLFNFKANIGRAYRAPSLTELASNGLDPGAHIVYLGNRNFKPEFSTQIDVGAAYQSPNLGLDLALFGNQLQNYISLQQLANTQGEPMIDAQGNKTFQYQQSSAQLYGLECAAYYQPSTLKNLRLDANASLVYGQNKGAQFSGTKNQGEYLPFMPPLQIFGKIAYQWEKVASFCPEISTSLSYEYAAKQVRFLALNDTETATPAYQLWHADVQSKWQVSKHLALNCSLFVHNILDHSYQSHLNRLKYMDSRPAPTPNFGIYNMGRNFGIKLSVDF